MLLTLDITAVINVSQYWFWKFLEENSMKEIVQNVFC